MKFTWLFAIYVVFVLSGYCFLTIAHEDAHVQACKYRGGNVTEKSVLPWNAYVLCSEHPTREDAQIEATGYPATVLFGLFSCGLFLAGIPYLTE